MNHTPEPRYSARSTTPHSWRVWDSYNNEPIAFCDSDDEARYIARALNALAGRVPGELARVEAAADHLLDCAHIPDDVRFLADSDWCIRISVSDYKKLRATLDAFRGEVQQ